MTGIFRLHVLPIRAHYTGYIVFFLFMSIACITSHNSAYARDIQYNQSILTKTAPRFEGSTNEERAIQFITSELDRTNAVYRLDTFSDYAEHYSRSKNIYVFIAGKKERTIVLATSINKESSYSISMLLHMIEKYQMYPPATNLIFAFLGADYWQEKYIHIGSQLFSSSLGSTSIDALLYVNIDFNPLVMQVDIGNTALVTERKLVEHMMHAAADANQDITIPTFWHTIAGPDAHFNNATSDFTSPTDYFLHQKIPTLTLSAANMQNALPLYNTVRSIENFIMLFDGFGSYSDKNYLLLPFANNMYTLHEVSIIYFLMCAYAFMCLVLYIRKKGLKRKYAPYMKEALLLFLFHSLAFASALYSSQFFVESIFNFFAIVDLWSYLSLLSIVLKATIAILLYMIFNAVIQKIYTVSNSTTYTVLAFISSGILQFTAFIDILFGIVAVWIMVSVIGIALCKNNTGKMVIFTVSLVLLAGYFGVYLTYLPYTAHQKIIFPDVISSIVLALVLLPYCFIYFETVAKKTRLLNNTARYAIVMSSAICIVIFFILYDPVITTIPNYINISEYVDRDAGSHILRYNSTIDKDTGYSIHIQDTEFNARINPRVATQELVLPYVDYYTIEHNHREIGEHRMHTLVIDSKESIQSLEMVLISDRNIDIARANIPYRNKEDNIISFHNIRNPDVPVALEFFIHNSFSAPLIIEATVKNDALLVKSTLNIDDGARYPRKYVLTTDTTTILRYNLSND